MVGEANKGNSKDPGYQYANLTGLRARGSLPFCLPHPPRPDCAVVRLSQLMAVCLILAASPHHLPLLSVWHTVHCRRFIAATCADTEDMQVGIFRGSEGAYHDWVVDEETLPQSKENNQKQLVTKYREVVESELTTICHEILNLLKDVCLKAEGLEPEEKVLAITV